MLLLCWERTGFVDELNMTSKQFQLMCNAVSGVLFGVCRRGLTAVSADTACWPCS